MNLIQQHHVEELTNFLVNHYPRVFFRDCVTSNIEDFEKRFDKIARRELWAIFQEKTNNLNSFRSSIKFLKSHPYTSENFEHSGTFYKRYFLCYFLEEYSNNINAYYAIHLEAFLDFT